MMESLIEKIKNGWAKIKTIKNIEIIIGIVIICLIVLIYSSVTAKSDKQKSGSPPQTEYSQSATEIEKRLGDILSEIDGAGNVSVMITYESTTGTTNSDDDEAIIKGVVIVADGANDLKVRINLVIATKTLLDIDANSIQIFDRK